MELCDELLEEKVSTACKKPGGIGFEFYIGHTENVASYTIDPTSKNLKTLTMKTGKRLWKFVGRIRENTAGTELGTDNGVVFNQSVTISSDANNNKDLAALKALCKAENLFIVYASNAGTYKVAGLNADIGQNAIYPGLRATAGSNSEGTAVGDSRAYSVTLSGPIDDFILHYEETGGLAGTKTALEALLVAAA